jgi:NADH-quinone oxidoreductase subunit C
LDATGEALWATLEQVFEADPGMKIGAAVDEVTFTVSPDRVLDVCNVCRTDPRLDFNYLRCLSVVDYVESTGEFEVNYHLYSLDKRHKMVVKTRVPEDQPSVPTVTGVWAGANWYERESHDLFGVVFEGHPELIPLLLYEEFEGFPGRKSFPFHDYDEW